MDTVQIKEENAALLLENKRLRLAQKKVHFIGSLSEFPCFMLLNMA